MKQENRMRDLNNKAYFTDSAPAFINNGSSKLKSKLPSHMRVAMGGTPVSGTDNIEGTGVSVLFQVKDRINAPADTSADFDTVSAIILSSNSNSVSSVDFSVDGSIKSNEAASSYSHRMNKMAESYDGSENSRESSFTAMNANSMISGLLRTAICISQETAGRQDIFILGGHDTELFFGDCPLMMEPILYNTENRTCEAVEAIEASQVRGSESAMEWN